MGFFKSNTTTANNDTSTAYIIKKTRELATQNPYVESKSNALLDVAKKISNFINENHLNLRQNKGQGTDAVSVVSSPVVKVEVMTKNVAGVSVPQQHKDGSFIFKCVISLTVGNSILTINAYESAKHPTEADISSVSLAKFVNTNEQKKKVIAIDLFDNEQIDKLSADMKKLIVYLKQEGIICRNTMREFYKKTNEKLSNEEPNKFTVKFIHDFKYGDSVQVASTNKAVQKIIEFSCFKNDYDKEVTTIKIIDFSQDPPCRTSLKDFDEIKEKILNKTLFSIATSFKGFDEVTGERLDATMLFNWSATANIMFKELAKANKYLITVEEKDNEGNTKINENGEPIMKTVADCYSQYKPKDEYKPERVELRSHSAKHLVVELRFNEQNQDEIIPIVKITDFSSKDANGRFEFSWINSQDDLNREEMNVVPEPIKDVIWSFKFQNTKSENVEELDEEL